MCRGRVLASISFFLVCCRFRGRFRGGLARGLAGQLDGTPLRRGFDTGLGLLGGEGLGGRLGFLDHDSSSPGDGRANAQSVDG